MKSSVKKVFAVLILAVVLVASLAAQSIYEKQPLFGKTIIIHTNDVHGALEGYSYLPLLREAFEEKGAQVILVDAGDFTNGNVYVSINKGEAAVELMNAAGYDVAGLGNHEFDFGVEQLRNNLKKAEFDVICSNVLVNGKLLYKPGISFKNLKTNIYFIGIETPETKTKVNPGLIKGVEFIDNEELWANTQKEINKAKKSGKADIVIALAHLGVNDESTGRRSYDLLDNVDGIDFVIDGHSHTVMEEGLNGELIQSTGTQFANIGIIVVDAVTSKIVDNYLIPTEDLVQDEDVLAKAKAIIDEIDAVYGAPFAVSEVTLPGDKNSNRSKESTGGDLITDAMVWKILKENPSMNAEDVIAITNGGGIRNAVNPGEVSRADIKSVLPFGNTLAVVYSTGAELLEVLEASTFETPGNVGGFPQVSGIKYTIDTTKPYDQGEQYPASTYYGPASIQRVTIDEINGQPFDAEKVYTIITNNFCMEGGDTYYAFNAAYLAGNAFDASIPLDEVVVEYIAEVLGGVIGQEYAEPQGRITIIK